MPAADDSRERCKGPDAKRLFERRQSASDGGQPRSIAIDATAAVAAAAAAVAARRPAWKRTVGEGKERRGRCMRRPTQEDDSFSAN